MPRTEREQAAAIGRELRSLVEGAVRDIARGVLTSASDATPRDTGATASAWRASARKSGPIVRRTPAAIAASEAAKVASGAKLAAYRLGPKIFVGNSMPGVAALNAGASSQEPRAFVQRAITRSLTLATATTAARAAAAGRRRRGRR